MNPNGHPPTTGVGIPGKRGLWGTGAGRQKGTPNKVNVERVEQEYRHIAFFDPRRLIAKIGKGKAARFTLKEIAELPDDVARCIASYDVVTQNLESGDGQQETVIKIRWYNKLDALEMIAKHLKYIDTKDGDTTNIAIYIERLQQARQIVNRRQPALPHASEP